MLLDTSDPKTLVILALALELRAQVWGQVASASKEARDKCGAVMK
jgi:hypothetical protein